MDSHINDSSDSVQIVSTESSRKRTCSERGSVITTNEVKKRSVSFSTYLKWRLEFDKKFQTISWLDCDVSGKGGRR